jgi:hypothetical protein
MRYFNLMLSPAEVAAYTATYLEESSPRADIARMMLRVVALTARLTTELEELRRSENSHSIWKLHADSLVVLIEMATKAAEAVKRLEMQVEQDESGPLRHSLEKLRKQTDQVVKTLASA